MCLSQNSTYFHARLAASVGGNLRLDQAIIMPEGFRLILILIAHLIHVKYSPIAQIVLIAEPHKRFVSLICLSLNKASDIKRLEQFVKGASADDPLLISEQGGRLQYRCIYSKIKSVGQKAGIGKLHPHMVRHIYLTRLYNVEKELRFVQDQAGHASPTTTAIYAKTNNAARKTQVEALDDENI